MTNEQLIAAGDPIASDAPYSPTYNPLGPGGPYDTANAAAAIGGAQASAPATPGGSLSQSGSLISGIDNLFPALGSLDNSVAGTSTSTAAPSSGGGIGGFFSFISNPARIGTVVIGGLMIAAGIFSLTRGKTIVAVPTLGAAKGSTEA